MTQYLITTFTDSTGQTFTGVTKARYNQTFTVVLAEYKDEALKIYEQDKGWQELLNIIRGEEERK